MEQNELARRVDAVRRAVEAAAVRSGRGAGDVTLVAVSKTVGADLVRQAWEAGLRDFGENRVQELQRKREELADLPCTWHLIGHLQSNKAKEALRNAALIHSVDSLPLARELSRRAVQMGEGFAPILIQVNISGEESKSGVAPEGALELIAAAGELPGLRVRGLMTIAQPVADPEEARPAFRAMRRLFERAGTELHSESVVMQYLSMGMSHDFEIAIEEGANIVRVGTAIFGEREYPAP